MIQRFIKGLRRNHRRVDTDGGSVPAEELRTDEEHVVAILHEHAGVAWQSHIVSSTTWSKSKVSRVLSRMEDDGAIRRYRIGRSNVVSLPGHEPDSLRRDYESLA